MHGLTMRGQPGFTQKMAANGARVILCMHQSSRSQGLRKPSSQADKFEKINGNLLQLAKQKLIR